MLNTEPNTKLNTASAGAVLINTLNSWRYLCGLSLVAYLSALSLTLFYAASLGWFIVSLLLTLGTQFFCWRLWLDTQLFKLLYQPESNQLAFDQALHHLWGKNSQPRSIESRWAGAKYLLLQAAIALLVQWVGIVGMVCWAII